MSTLGYVLLGLLARAAQSGYDLAQQLKAPIGFFWSACHSQIYPELARLESHGLISHQLITQEDRPDKKLYLINEAGRAALHDWLHTPVPPAPTRDELMLRAYSLWLADPAKAAALFRQHASIHAMRQAHCQARLAELEAAHNGPPPRDSPAFGSYAVLRRGLGNEREYAEWCRWLADTLEA